MIHMFPSPSGISVLQIGIGNAFASGDGVFPSPSGISVLQMKEFEARMRQYESFRPLRGYRFFKSCPLRCNIYAVENAVLRRKNIFLYFYCLLLEKSSLSPHISYCGAKACFSPLQNIIQGFRMGRKDLPSGRLYFKRYKNPKSIGIFSRALSLPSLRQLQDRTAVSARDECLVAGEIAVRDPRLSRLPRGSPLRELFL